jgi:molybdopterin converting factor small subunit
MATIRIPTPLRPYTNSQAEITVAGDTVGAALSDLTRQHPGLRQHLYAEDGRLRAFVNVFLNEEDIRHVRGVDTPVKEQDRLMIVPSIAGGSAEPGSRPLQTVDHSALRTNQALIIGLLLIAFVVDAGWLAAAVLLVMAHGTLRRQPGFRFVYAGLLKPRGWVKPDILRDNPEPHVFAQGFGAAVLLAAVGALLAGLPVLGWGLIWLVVALAALNLFVGFCAGCAVYYWLGRLRLPGFIKAPPPGTIPGMRPKGS